MSTNHDKRTVDAYCQKCGNRYEVDEARWWRITGNGNADTAKCPKCMETLNAGDGSDRYKTVVVPADEAKAFREKSGTITISRARLAEALALAAMAALHEKQYGYGPKIAVACTRFLVADDASSAIAAAILRGLEEGA